MKQWLRQLLCGIKGHKPIKHFTRVQTGGWQYQGTFCDWCGKELR